MQSIWRPVGAAVRRLLDDYAVASGSQLTPKLVHDTNTLLWERLKLCGIVRGDGLNLKRRPQSWKWSPMALPMLCFASVSWDRDVVDE